MESSRDRADYGSESEDNLQDIQPGPDLEGLRDIDNQDEHVQYHFS